MDLQDHAAFFSRPAVSCLPPVYTDNRYTFPIPIPASHVFFLSELDYNDGFVHLSSARQVGGTLNRFFADMPSIVLLRLETERVSAFKRIRWEESHGDSEFAASVAVWEPRAAMRDSCNRGSELV